MARILHVDDDPAVLRSVCVILEGEGHEVISMAESEKAAERLREGPFDLLITDIEMRPVDGLEMMRIAASLNPPVTVIAMSVHTSADTMQKATAAGCRAYLKKPCKFESVVETIRYALSKP